MRLSILLIASFIIISCADVKEGTVHVCKNCSKVISDETTTKSVLFLSKDSHKITEDLSGYCDSCGNEMVPYTVSHVCKVCNRVYKTDESLAKRKEEHTDEEVEGVCSDNCKNVTITDNGLLQIYNDLAGEGLNNGKYTSVTKKDVWRNNYFHKYVIASGTVYDVREEFFGDETYIDLQLSTSHYVSIYLKPSQKKYLKQLQKGATITFTGRLTELGTGIAFRHEIDNAEIIKID